LREQTARWMTKHIQLTTDTDAVQNRLPPRNSRETGSPSSTRRSRPTTPRTTKRSWSELSKVACPYLDGIEQKVDVRSLNRGRWINVIRCTR
jgi:hypothetical protein